MSSSTERLELESYSAGITGLIPTKLVKFEEQNGGALIGGDSSRKVIFTCNAGNPGVLDFAPRSAVAVCHPHIASAK